MKLLIKFALKIRNSLNRGGDYNFFSKRNSGKSIPKVIHQTYHSKTLPPEIQENIDHLKSMSPDWEHSTYDDDDITNYIDTNYLELVGIYNKINPVYGAARADFFRYILIYKEDGVYLDIKCGLSKPLNAILGSKDCYLLCHRQNNQEGEIDEIEAVIVAFPILLVSLNNGILHQ